MTNFSKEGLNKMQEDFCSILRQVKRDNANIEGLIEKLKTTDFFTAPASTKFHNCIEGGLVNHSLNVYYNLKNLVKISNCEDIISEESIIICGLLHDMSKMNMYERGVRNKKVYSDNGSKWDDLGRYDWVSESCWSVIPEKERFVYGNHEETSEFMVRHYIPLTLEESIAILHHHAGKGFDSSQLNLSGIMHRYPLLVLLHTADMIATFIDESDE